MESIVAEADHQTIASRPSLGEQRDVSRMQQVEAAVREIDMQPLLTPMGDLRMARIKALPLMASARPHV
jgi:hypothetical protein